MNGEDIRQLERGSIRSFMERNRQYLHGRVLDFGAGKQPYRDLVEGDYVSVCEGDLLPSGDFDAIMCNQVMQYLVKPEEELALFHTWLIERRGHLVMTYATNWDEVETTDLWRFTKSGMARLLQAGFEILIHERRAEIDLNGFKFPLGYGVVARAC